MPQLIGVIVVIVAIGAIIEYAILPLLGYLFVLLFQTSVPFVIAMLFAFVATSFLTGSGNSKKRLAEHYSHSFEDMKTLLVSPNENGMAWMRDRVNGHLRCWLGIAILCLWGLLLHYEMYRPQPFMFGSTIPASGHAAISLITMMGGGFGFVKRVALGLIERGIGGLITERIELGGLPKLIELEKTLQRTLQSMNAGKSNSELANLGSWIDFNLQTVLNDPNALEREIVQRTSKLSVDVLNALDNLERWVTTKFRLEQLELRLQRSGGLIQPNMPRPLIARHTAAIRFVKDKAFDTFVAEMTEIEDQLTRAGG